ncbi:rho GTPase-activating protein 5-like [Vigna unguiculata]|uniref:RalA-binding protein 1 n=1 Tax=Vigna unguiculata TaxID=3917 RepID=A0A4D6KPC4_VIGUN|nr:rho GTPase-activating protein 5-like [Vigna unguiculata]QCD77497.1 RalA-binding protein 1 [Vigna unguiculata]
MTRLFRSKSCGLVEFNVAPPSPLFHDVRNEEEDSEEDEEEEEEELDSDEEDDDGDEDVSSNPVSTPFINSGSKVGGGLDNKGWRGHGCQSNQFAILDILVAALKKSLLVTCSVEREDVSSLDISWPTEVRHVSHVTFDRFNGFLGLPSELEPEVPKRVPSASAKVFGVSAKSMQCSYDERGNSVPTILLMMQKRLYSEGGLKSEGIFRINADNSQEEFVRDQLNRGLVPLGIDVHCLSGLVKAWFRELPTGVLDSLTPEQVMHCNTEEDCTNLMKLLPSTEAALLDWAINLMADVVEQEQFNKMNARNIAMVFAPNMTQMADPLTALIHAVQVMNFLKTLILKTLREREESVAKVRQLSSLLDSPSCKGDSHPLECKNEEEESCEESKETCTRKSPVKSKFSRTSTLGRIEWCIEEKLWRPEEKGNGGGESESVSACSSPSRYENGSLENGYRGIYDSEHWVRLRKGMRRLCRHPVFKLSKPTKKSESLGIVDTREEGGKAWV